MIRLRLIAFFTALTLLAACGYKGDLFLPSDKDPAKKEERRDTP